MVQLENEFTIGPDFTPHMVRHRRPARVPLSLCYFYRISLIVSSYQSRTITPGARAISRSALGPSTSPVSTLTQADSPAIDPTTSRSWFSHSTSGERWPALSSLLSAQLMLIRPHLRSERVNRDAPFYFAGRPLSSRPLSFFHAPLILIDLRPNRDPGRLFRSLGRRRVRFLSTVHRSRL